MKKAVLITLIVILGVGCHKHKLEEPDFVRVTVKAYWDLAEIRPQNATLLVYDSRGALYREVRTGSEADYAQFRINLGVGRYTLVVFNELRNQIDKVGIRGWQQLETLEAYIIANDKPIYTFGTGGELVHQPGILATANCQVEVTNEMIHGTYYYDRVKSIELHPDRKTAQSIVNIAVKGISNSRMPVAGQLRNMASSYFFATDRNSLAPVSTQFPINNRTYNSGSSVDGTISATITTFGVLGEWHHIADTPDNKFYLDLAFMLVDKQRTVVIAEEDITELIEILVDTKLQVTLNINLETTPLPFVIPEGSGEGNTSGSGFNADLADWNNTIVPLPM